MHSKKSHSLGSSRYFLSLVFFLLSTIIKKHFLFIILLFVTSLSIAQIEEANDKTISGNFEKKFNSNDFNGIFGLFSNEMKAALPKTETNEFLTDLKNQAGQIKAREFGK